MTFGSAVRRQPRSILAWLMHSLPPVALGAFLRSRNRRDSKNLNHEGPHEPLRAIYSAAGGHNPADGGHCHCRAIAFNVLPVSPLPQVDFPTISVSASLPGASAQIMASSVATPLERQFGHIAGITEMTSSSSLGSTNVTLQFDLSRNIDAAARDVEAAINAARTYLPANLPANPSYRKVNPADSPIMIIGLTSDKYDKAGDVRLRLHHHGAEALADSGRGTGDRRRRVLPVGARGSQSHRN